MAMCTCSNIIIYAVFLFIFQSVLTDNAIAYRSYNASSSYSLWIQQIFGSLHLDRCYDQKYWILKHFDEWDFSEHQVLISYFPLDLETRNYVREVRNILFSIVYPTPLKRNPLLAAVSKDTLSTILDLDEDVKFSTTFMKFVAGNRVLPGSKPLAHR